MPSAYKVLHGATRVAVVNCKENWCFLLIKGCSRRLRVAACMVYNKLVPSARLYGQLVPSANPIYQQHRHISAMAFRCPYFISVKWRPFRITSFVMVKF